jgi:hypothetical protein
MKELTTERLIFIIFDRLMGRTEIRTKESIFTEF